MLKFEDVFDFRWIHYVNTNLPEFEIKYETRDANCWPNKR